MKDLRILYIKTKTSTYPSSWIPINWDGKQFYYGGSNILVFDYSAKKAQIIKRMIEKQTKDKLFIITKKIKEFDNSNKELKGEKE